MSYVAVVLAGQRQRRHPVADAAGVPAAVLAPVAGRPMLARVLDALAASPQVVAGAIVGDRAALQADAAVRDAAIGFRWQAALQGPSASARAALEMLNVYPALLTTGDHALLSPALVEEFCRQARRADADFVIGVVEHARLQAPSLRALPPTRRTLLRFGDGAICGCNLYAVMRPAGLAALALWQQVEADRKRPWRVIRRLGLRHLLRYWRGRLTLAEGMARLSVLAGARIGAVKLSRAEAAVDVDTLADLQFAEAWLRAGAEARGRVPLG
jgi:molybdopterin-guanine dinucleotide biosynthesis protein A